MAKRDSSARAEEVDVVVDLVPSARPDDDAVHVDFRERFALVFTNFGLQRMVARVYAALLVSESPTTTMPELAETLNASAGAISGAVKTLVTIGLVEQVPAPGSRRDHYRIADDGWYKAMIQKNQLIIREMQELAADGARVMGDRTVAGHRLAEMRDFYGVMYEETPRLLRRWEEFRETSRAARES